MWLTPASLLQPISELVDGEGSVIHVNDRKLVSGAHRPCQTHLGCQQGGGRMEGWHVCLLFSMRACPPSGALSFAWPCLVQPGLTCSMHSPACRAAMKVRLKFSGTNGHMET